MNPLLKYLSIYILWTIFLLLTFGFQRVLNVLLRKSQPQDFPAGVPHGPPLYWRLNRAHLNCLENLPIFASLILIVMLSGQHDPIYNTLGLIIINARVAQSIAHIVSESSLAIHVRFTFFLTQIVCYTIFVIKLLMGTM